MQSEHTHGLILFNACEAATGKAWSPRVRINMVLSSVVPSKMEVDDYKMSVMCGKSVDLLG